MKSNTIRARFGDKVTVDQHKDGIRLVIEQKRSCRLPASLSLFLTPAGARLLAAALVVTADEEEGT